MHNAARIDRLHVAASILNDPNCVHFARIIFINKLEKMTVLKAVSDRWFGSKFYSNKINLN